MRFFIVSTCQFFLRRWHHVFSSFPGILSVSLLRVLIIKVPNKPQRVSQQGTLLEPRTYLILEDRGFKRQTKPESAQMTGFCPGSGGREPSSSQQVGSRVGSKPGMEDFLTIIKEINCSQKGLQPAFWRRHVTFFFTMEPDFRWETLCQATTYLLYPNCLGFSLTMGDIGAFFNLWDDGTSDLSRPRSSITVSISLL